ncbi:hypothetical protein BJV82DRAFT_604697 [Fennellomyces sp. T-0311]|nr:hypothetical protein BJV82DRAFT_604697 [Fennellomyces sp. T-0311]
MKSITVASIAVLGFVSNAAANLAVLTPWNGVTWMSGGTADVTWSADVNDASAECHIQLMNGDTNNGQVVAYITNPQVPVPCSDRRYDITPLNDFSPGEYWVRVGSGDKWAYSSKFKFQGNGSVNTSGKLSAPVNILLGESNGSFNPSASASASASAPPGASSAAGGSPAATPSGPATSIKSGASIAPSGSTSNAPASSASANLSLSGSPSSSSSSGSSSSTSSSSSGRGTSNKKKNAKTENSASTQSNQGWMMVGVAALFAAMAL